MTPVGNYDALRSHPVLFEVLIFRKTSIDTMVEYGIYLWIVNRLPDKTHPYDGDPLH